MTPQGRLVPQMALMMPLETPLSAPRLAGPGLTMQICSPSKNKFIGRVRLTDRDLARNVAKSTKHACDWLRLTAYSLCCSSLRGYAQDDRQIRRYLFVHQLAHTWSAAIRRQNTCKSCIYGANVEIENMPITFCTRVVEA